MTEQYGPNAADLEKLVFALRSELGRMRDVIQEHRIKDPILPERGSFSGVRISSIDEIGTLAERVSDLWANERELLRRQNDELKALVRNLKAGPVSQGSALQQWAKRGDMTKVETLEMLKDATAKHAAAQEKLLRAEHELSDLQEAHWKAEEEKAELEVRIKAQAKDLDLKTRQLAEKELQLSATTRSLGEKAAQNPAAAEDFIVPRGSLQAAGSEVQVNLHRRVQQLLRELQQKDVTIKSLTHRLETQRAVISAGPVDPTNVSHGSGAAARVATVSELERTMAMQRAEHNDRMDIVEEQVSGLLALSEERRVLLEEQDRRIQSLNEELANRQGVIDDQRRRLASQATALKEAAAASSSLEDRMQDESAAVVEARRARTLAEENMVAAQREAESARQEAKVGAVLARPCV